MKRRPHHPAPVSTRRSSVPTPSPPRQSGRVAAANLLQQSVGNRATSDLIQRAGPDTGAPPSMVSYSYWSELVRGLLLDAAVPFLIGVSGIRDENKLTNLLFWAEHPDHIGQKIPSDRKDLARDWIRLRNDFVRPALTTAPAMPAPGPGPTPAPTPAPGPGPSAPPAPAPAPVPAGPTPIPMPSTPTTGPAPAPVSPPASGSPIQKDDLHTYLKAFPQPLVAEIDSSVARLENLSVELGKKRGKGEERGQGRDDLVAGIGDVRTKIAQLDSAGVPGDQLAALTGHLYRAVADLTPYYSQGQNIDLLEGKARAKELGEETSVNTRTCNLTAVSMCLEQLGKSAADYDGAKEEHLLVAAERFASIVDTGKLRVNGTGTDLEAVRGLRLPDFMQLVAIAEEMSAPTAKAADAAVHVAWSKILNIYHLQKLARRFGVSASVKVFTLDPAAYAAAAQAFRDANRKKKKSRAERAEAKKLKKARDKDLKALTDVAGSKTRRRNVLKLAAARRELADATTDKKRARAQKKANALEKKLGDVATASDETRMPIEQYRNAVLDQVGPELDSGKAVIVSVTGHYVRLQNLTPDRVLIDDSANFTNYDVSVSYAEARAAGFFKRRIVLG